MLIYTEFLFVKLPPHLADERLSGSNWDSVISKCFHLVIKAPCLFTISNYCMFLIRVLYYLFALELQYLFLFLLILVNFLYSIGQL